MQIYSAVRLHANIPKGFVYVGAQLISCGLIYFLCERKVRSSKLKWGPFWKNAFLKEPEVSKRSLGTFWVTVGVFAFFVLPYFLGFSREGLMSIGSVLKSFQNSLMLSFMLSIGVGLCVMMLTLIVYYFQLPRAWIYSFGFVSPLVLSYGVWFILWNFQGEQRYSWMGVFIVYVILWLPYALRSAESISHWRELEETQVARVLGANWRGVFWKIEWPRVKAVFYRTFSLALGFSLVEVAAISLFIGAEQEHQTLALKIFRAQSHYQFHEVEGGLMILLCISLLLSYGLNLRTLNGIDNDLGL
jgi:ABC-type Fe3+ transport system permease subunit